MIITSRNNEKIKEIKKLIKDGSLIFLDTENLISEAVKRNIKPEIVIIKEKNKNLSESMDSITSLQNDKKKNSVGTLQDDVKKDSANLLGNDVSNLTVSENVFESFFDFETNLDYAYLIKRPKAEFRLPEGNFLVLDSLQDPGNIGTLIRSAMGADFLNIYLINCANPFSQKVLRSTSGAIFSASIYEFKNYEDFILQFDSLKNIIYCADMNGENLYKKKFTGQTGIIIGNEGNGVHEKLLKFCKNKISIPMKNNLESLNAAVAGSIIMSYITFQKN